MLWLGLRGKGMSTDVIDVIKTIFSNEVKHVCT